MILEQDKSPPGNVFHFMVVIGKGLIYCLLLEQRIAV